MSVKPLTGAELLAQGYDPAVLEDKWLRHWLEQNAFAAEVDDSKEPYSVILPPPNVTGALHMGHALNGTLQDVLIRYQRMQGKSVLWQPGLDHAGIATQTVVERQLREDGIDRRDLGRDAFLEKVWQWRNKSGDKIIEQQKRLGASCDWERLRFTMDDHSSSAVLECFVQLWNEGLIYRGERLINWDPATQTALSDLEVEHEERDGEMWRFAYRVRDEDKEIVVATTRPETMLGDTAVAVHPEDERYQALIGKALVHPFFSDREIHIVADDHVDPEFGTGAVKITPAHDPNDFAIGSRHDLELINILTLDARINEHGGEFSGLDRFDARKEVKQRIKDLGLDRGSEQIRHAVTVSQRSGDVVEPMISRQYFVKMDGMAKAAQDAVNNGETNIIPEGWKKTWDHFLDNIEDWCISRQLWWGHRIPVFYDIRKLEKCIRQDAADKQEKTEASIALDAGASTSYVLKTALSTLPEDYIREFSVASTEDLTAQDPERYVQEEDVLDTWFSSALWPFSTLGWPNETKDLNFWYPSSALITAFDILFFWVARMMMMGIHLMGKVPFDDVVLHAIVRDEHGEKMSKTKGNVVDPLVLIDQFGADALRFTLTAMTSLGRDISLDPKRIEGYQHFANKIWNACRYILHTLDGRDEVNLDLEPEHPINRWILSALGDVSGQAAKHLDTYQFGAYAHDIYQFSWDTFCDWYIESSKVLLRDDTYKEETLGTLVKAFDGILRLLHVSMPFITEELATTLPVPRPGMLTHSTFPQKEDYIRDEAATQNVAELQDIVHAIRAIRGENGLAPNQSLDVLFHSDSDSILTDETWQPMIQALAKAKSLQPIEPQDAPDFSGTHTSGHFSLWVALDGLVDVKGEIERLTKSIEKTTLDKTKTEKKLNNPAFVDKAPEHVVAAEKEKLEEFTQILDQANQQLDRLNKVAGQ